MSVVHGTILAFVAYAALAFGDGVIKGLGGRLPVFEIAFFFGIFAALATLFMRPGTERWRDVFQMKHPWLVQARALTGIFAGLLGVFAFTTIPFAEAYALVFMAPFMVMLLSTLILREKVGWLGWAAMATGLAGVLVVVRPGMRALEWGHLSAFGVAIFAALTVIILRRIAGDEKRTTLLGIPQLYALGVTGAVTATRFVLPTATELALLAGAGLLGALGQFALLAGAKRAPAYAVGQAQYSQLLWAVLIGALFYAEYPDGIAMVGLAIIVAAGLMNVAEQRGRGREQGSRVS